MGRFSKTTNTTMTQQLPTHTVGYIAVCILLVIWTRILLFWLT